MTTDNLINHIHSILRDNRPQKSLNELYESKKSELGLSDTQIATVLRMDYNTLKNIVTGKQQKVDYVAFLKISRFLHVSLTDLANIYHKDDLELASELGSVLKSTYIVENFDLKTLKQIGFLNSVSDYEEAEKKIVSYFGLDRLSDYEYLSSGVMFSQSKRTPQIRMRGFWIRSAHTLFKKIANPNDYDREKLKKLLPKIKPYTKNVSSGLKTVAQALYNIGVTVVYQPYLSGTQVRGGTFCINDKPCIVITDFNKSYPTLWFTLLHELHHALFDLEAIKDSKYHLSGDDLPDIFLLDEGKADNFAREFLFSQEKCSYIKPFINDPLIVERFARDCEIHPSIIYSFYQWDSSSKGNNYWGAYRKYFPDYKIAISSLNVVPWESGSLEEAVENIKKTLTQLI